MSWRAWAHLNPNEWKLGEALYQQIQLPRLHYSHLHELKQHHASLISLANKTAGRHIQQNCGVPLASQKQIFQIPCQSYSSKLFIKADNTGLTISGDSAEVLLQLGHVEWGIQRFGVHLVIAECSGGEVGVRGVEAGRGDAAGHLQQSSEE